MSHSYPSHVTIVDVSPRDGLQNESMTVPTEVKQTLNTLIDTTIDVFLTKGFTR